VALNSGATELGIFNEETADDVINYYRDVDYVRGLIDSIHEGRELPPAAYTLLESRFDEIENQTDELIEQIEIETRWLPRTYRLYEWICEFREKYYLPLRYNNS
jgi:hypothetical protein